MTSLFVARKSSVTSWNKYPSFSSSGGSSCRIQCCPLCIQPMPRRSGLQDNKGADQMARPLAQCSALLPQLTPTGTFRPPVCNVALNHSLTSLSQAISDLRGH